jgi:ribonucleoside-diphosphate reductase alpha chain
MSDISRQIWDMKYRLKAADGTPVDRDMADTWARVALAAAKAEAPEKRREWALGFRRGSGRASVPARRTHPRRRRHRPQRHPLQLLCDGRVPTTWAASLRALREAALTMQQGGGIGYDFSTLRPKGAPVKGVGADASGPVSFMEVWDAMCRTIMSAGSRRGAMMATLACDHPTSKRSSKPSVRPAASRCSICRCSRTMRSCRGESRRALGSQIRRQNLQDVDARDLWDRIMRATYEYAEPGVIFIDRINAENNLAYCETIHATNPCGEQPLPPYGACLLGSINLATLVRHPFEENAALDEDALARHVRTAVRFLDNVIDVSRFPLPEQRAEAFAKRRLGLGVTGLADALIFCRARYGAPESIALIDRWLSKLSLAAYSASAEIAEEKGAFPLFDREEYLARPNIAKLPGRSPRIASRRMASATRWSPRSRRRARFRCSRAMCRAASSPFSPIPIRARCCSTTERAARSRSPISPTGASAKYSARKRFCRIISSTRRRSRRKIIWPCRPPRKGISTARSPRRSTCPRRFLRCVQGHLFERL